MILGNSEMLCDYLGESRMIINDEVSSQTRDRGLDVKGKVYYWVW